MHIASIPHNPAKPENVRYDAKTGEPLYPFAPQHYDRIDLVGFRLENGEYLPTKIFVQGNFGIGQRELKSLLWQRFAVGLLTGMLIVLCGIVAIP
jgi:hypothetical protein